MHYHEQKMKRTLWKRKKKPSLTFPGVSFNLKFGVLHRCSATFSVSRIGKVEEGLKNIPHGTISVQHKQPATLLP